MTCWNPTLIIAAIGFYRNEPVLARIVIHHRNEECHDGHLRCSKAVVDSATWQHHDITWAISAVVVVVVVVGRFGNGGFHDIHDVGSDAARVSFRLLQ